MSFDPDPSKQAQDIVGRGFINLLFYEDLPTFILPTPTHFFQILSNTLSPPTSHQNAFFLLPGFVD